MNIIRWIVVLALSTIITACGVIDYIISSDSQGAIEGGGIVEPPTIGEAPPPLHYVIGDAISPLDQSSYCWTSGSSGICVDMIPPIYEEDQHILFPSRNLELVFFPPVPDSATAWLHTGSNIMEEGDDIELDAQLSEDGILLLTIPENVSGRFILLVFAQWEARGDSLYTMPILLE